VSADPGAPLRLDPLAALDLAQTGAASVIAHLTDADWGRPTPCDQWTVRDVLNKMVASTLMFAAFGRRQRLDPPYDLVNPAEIVGTDPLGAFLDAADECRSVWREAGALDGTAPSTVGEFPAKAVLNARIFDTTILTCDLAAATGHRHGVEDPLAAYVLRVARALVPTVRSVSSERYKDAPPTDEGAPLVDQMLATTGRDPHWTPPR
jgi:uncharacterized protein (TIGR03086 family)